MTDQPSWLGGRVIACSDSSGYVVDEKGVDVALLKQIKEEERGRIVEYAQRRGGAVRFVEKRSVWEVKCQEAMPCAIQNELGGEDAARLISGGLELIAEGANMPCTPEAIQAFRQAGIPFGPGKAANAGGVAASALEMQQNASRDFWTFEYSEKRLREIMRGIHERCFRTAESYGRPGDYVAGANIAGFLQVADALLALGVI